MKKHFLLAIFLTLIFFPKVILAALGAAEVTNSFQLADTGAVDGDIVINATDGLRRTDLPADVRIFGVVQKNPIIVIRPVGGGQEPIVRSGVANVNVISANGVINKGDYITSSEVRGKGQRATKSGYTLGVALAPLTGNEGQIPVAVKIEYTEIASARTLARLFDFIGAAFFKDVREPGKFVEIMRNIIAGLVVIVSFSFAFITFSRSVPKAIEAIGRNPLARRFIYLSMMFNIALIIGTILFGIVAAIVILRVR